MGKRQLPVDLRNHQRRFAHSGQRHINTGAERIEAFGVGRRNRDQTGVGLFLPGQERRDGREKAGQIVHAFVIEKGPDVGPHKEIADTESAGVLGPAVHRLAHGVQMHELKRLAVRGIGDQRVD